MHNMEGVKIEIEDLSAVKKKLTITVSAEVVRDEVATAYRSLRSGVAIAGFRKGNVPMNILRARFSDHVREDVTKKIVESSYPHALHEKGLVPVAPPQVELTTPSFDEAGELAFTATVEVSPRVEVEGYKGMELSKKLVEVADKDVEDAIEKLRNARAEYKEVDRPAEQGDLVVTDFESSLDGQPIKNGKGTDVTVIIGERTPLPGYDEAVKGVKKGETKAADITFPQNISTQELAGKTAQFSITVKTVKQKAVPALDEEFAKDLECESLQVFKDRVREDLVKVKEAEEKERLKNEILDKLIEKHPFEVPDALVNRYQAILLNKLAENMSQGFMPPGDENLSLDELKAKYREKAARHVKEDIILDTIAALEKLEASTEDVEKAIRSLAAQRNVAFDALMARIEQEGALEMVKDGIKHEKVFDIILEAVKPAA